MTTVAATATIHAIGREKLLGHLAMLLFAALIAGSFTLGALAVPYLAPAPLNAVRFLIATLIMGAVTFGMAREKLVFPVAPWRPALLGALMAIYFVTMFIALEMTEPVATSAVFTLIPLMTAAFGHLLLRQRTRAVVLLSLLCAGLGSLWVIFRGDVGAIAGFDLGAGEIVFFCGCIAYALYAPLVRRFNRGETALVFSFWALAASTVWIAAYGWTDIWATDWAGLPAIVWWSIAYLAVFPTAGTFFLLQYASMRLPASKVLAYGYLTPVFVILLEGLVGHGWANLSVVAGALLTVLGLLVVALAPDQ